MRRYILVALPKNLDNHLTVAEFRALNRDRYVYQALNIIPPPNGVGAAPAPGSTIPHPVYVDDNLGVLEEAARVNAQTHPQFQWCIFDLLTITSGQYTEVKVSTKKRSEKGILP